MQNTVENRPVAGSHRAPVAWALFPQSTVFAIGKDAVRFVDNFVTASVSSVPEGGGTEAFVTDTRGHVIALVTILRTASSLEIIAPPGSGERLRDHLEHFHIREAVEIVDGSDAIGALGVLGLEATGTLASFNASALPLPSSDLGHDVISIAGHDVRVVRVTSQGADGYVIRGPHAAIDAISRSLASAGVPRMSDAALDAARIAAGYPSVLDIDAKTLPQELGRDARAISFTKGCYLGQETVARLDALGHVNRRLVIVGIDSDHAAACPAPILHADDVVGTLTSCCQSPLHEMAIGLGIVHTKALIATSLVIDAASARILAVPPAHLESA